MKYSCLVLFFAVLAPLHAAEWHVATNGNDTADGSLTQPFRTIQKAADVAQPGDVVTVHEGVYRERINPPRGGESDMNRIVYQAAPGGKVEIKGSEVVRNWTRVHGDVWTSSLPNAFFGEFNPFKDLIRGDWFDPKGREHHTGAVYHNGEWLVEAGTLDEVLGKPGGESAKKRGGEVLMNVVWLRLAGVEERIAADGFAAYDGVKKAGCSEGGQCIGWIEHGDWVRYDNVNFGERCDRVEIRAASETTGGRVDLRLGDVNGELLGVCSVPNTRGWQSWATFEAPIKPTGGVKPLCVVFSKPRQAGALDQKWFARVDDTNTTVWAQFPGVDPNEQLVEVNARRTVFYPDKPGCNFITVRGFIMCHAATPWAPPTAEQVGLIGTHWSRGWIIESNVVSHSTCSGIALGKHGDEFDNTSANSAGGYVKTIERAQAFRIPWTKENIGHHIVRGNTISHCEQTAIVGSLGAAFSTVTGNTIHDIHVRHLFGGAEMAGIKFHAPIDTLIAGNHIYRCAMGLWLDWMAQGTRVTRNLFHDNGGMDLFVEVNHGPFLVDNNLFLSPTALVDMSEGGAYAHNLMAGKISSRPELSRDTPYHPAHSTKVAGLVNVKGGDDRFYNNIFIGAGVEPAVPAKPSDDAKMKSDVGFGLWIYDQREFPLQAGGNVYFNGARPFANEADPLTLPAAFEWKLVEQNGAWRLQTALPPELTNVPTRLVTTELLGKTRVAAVAYENADGTSLAVDTDYFGSRRSVDKPMPGPFENKAVGDVVFQVWPSTANGTVCVFADKECGTIPDAVYGQFIEHLGYCINGPIGLWAEIVQDRKFAHDFTKPVSPNAGNKPVPVWWVMTGQVVMARGKEAFVGAQSPRLSDGAMICQTGVVLRAAVRYEGRIVLSGTPGAVCEVTLRAANGFTRAIRLSELGAAWETRSLSFDCDRVVTNASLAISAYGGAVTLGTVSLMPDDNMAGFRRDIVEKMKELKAPNYRWPGGCYVGAWKWKEQLGDRDKRAPRNAGEPNDVGLHEFMTLCKELEAVPVICVNTGRFGEHGTPEYNRDLVLYCNSVGTPMAEWRSQNGHPAPFGVKLWAIGNEMFGKWQYGHYDTVEEYAQKHNQVVSAMRQADPSIEVLAVGYIGEKSQEIDTRDQLTIGPTSSNWNQTMFEQCASNIDFISEHFYSNPTTLKGKDLFGHMTDLRDNLEVRFDLYRRLYKETGVFKPVMLDEWNYWYGPNVYGQVGPAYFHKDGLGVAAGLHAVFRNCDIVAGCNFAQTVNVLGAICANRTESTFSTVGLPLVLYRQHFGKHLVTIENTNPKLEVVAAWTADRKALTVSLINFSKEALKVPLAFQGCSPVLGETSWYFIRHANPDVQNVPGRIPDLRIEQAKLTGPLAEIQLEPYSINLLVVPVIFI